jgi:pyrroline-5-carboxylate reductase
VSETAAPARLWLVGAGNMGGAMLRRSVPEGVTVVAAPPPGDTPDILILAVKPQMLDSVAPSLAAIAAPMLVSILAGVEVAALRDRFAAQAIVRAMPNLPVAIGKGVVALHSDSAAPAVRAAAEALMAPLGHVEWVDEGLFDVVTALSGSGPGFTYRFIDALAKGGAALGLPADQALRLASATVEGSAMLAAGAEESPAILADRVASPGGSTREGLNVLDADGALVGLLTDTLDAATRRNAELAAAARR